MTVVERFLKYVKYDTKSNEFSDSFPSSKGQMTLADELVEELKEIGLSDAYRDENGYVYAHIPANCDNAPKIGLIAHMDTSPDVSGKDVTAKIIIYDGTNAKMLDDCYIGCEMIVTDTTTLLGADDKAGIAEIVSACETIINSKYHKHGQISICFTPDEEIGNGADRFDHKQFDADFAYTIDGGELGEIEYENFNAAACTVTINGINTHPGTAKNKMKNAVLYASEFISMLPPEETPAHTEGKEGFYHASYMKADESSALIRLIIRDHDKDSFMRRKAFIRSLTEYLNNKYGAGTFETDITDSYYNMKEIIESHPEIIERAKKAMSDAAVEPIIIPIRGGTDGARLSFEGLPCPNLSAGGINFHSIYEAIPTKSLYKMTEVLINITVQK